MKRNHKNSPSKFLWLYIISVTGGPHMGVKTGKITKSIGWRDVVAKAAEETGISKKQLEEDCAAVAKTIQGLMESDRPKKIGEQTLIKTPFAAYSVSYVPAEIGIDTKTGKKTERSACYGVALGAPKAFVDAANTGIVLEKKAVEDAEEKPAAKRKSA